MKNYTFTNSRYAREITYVCLTSTEIEKLLKLDQQLFISPIQKCSLGI